MKVKFLGAATSVTGSCHLITTEKHKILLDCGQFQGSDEMDSLNRQGFDFDPKEIDLVILSHSHIDHSGRLPLLVKRGFEGSIYCTDATADLLEVMLRDSGFIHEKEAEWKNRKNQRAGRSFVEPLYTVKDAEAALQHVKPILYDQLVQLNDEMSLVFNDAGHILGSSIVELFVTENDGYSKLVFSGDIGVKGRPILRDPKTIKKADYLIMESTYGNRVHDPNSSSIRSLIDIVIRTAKRGGTIVIPSFAVGRTQELIYEFNRFYEENSAYKEALDQIMVYVDSPMATSATEIFRKNAQVFDDEMKAYILSGDHPLDFKNLKFTRTGDESRALNFDPKPKVIISASGMCEAGRIKHHLKHNLWNPNSSIVFVGYQAEGTLGRSIVKGDKDVSIFGEKIHVEAEIYNLEGFSGHADRDGLLDWLSGFQVAPSQIFLVHGEEQAKKDFAVTIKSVLGFDCTPVLAVSEYTLSKDGTSRTDDPREELASKESIVSIKQKLSSIHEALETILYNTELAVDGELSPAQITEINNVVLELEKTTINLGSTVALDRQPTNE